jgi:hypothetical protein
MKTCLYCLGEISDAATKCRHCGEWVHNVETEGPGGLVDKSETNPAIRRAEHNVENVRFLWKACLLLCFGASLVFLVKGDHETDTTIWLILAFSGAVLSIGILVATLLSSISHVVELLVLILKNQLHRENHFASRLRKLQQSLHE